jgi:hypothetical protein
MVKQNVDIWSFGCILTEAAVWLIHGYPGLQDFRLSRKAAISAIPEMKDGDWFHDGTKVLPIVLETMDSLEKDFRKSDGVTAAILDKLVKVMLDEPEVRYTAKQAHTHALRILPRPNIAISSVTGPSPKSPESFPPATGATPTITDAEPLPVQNTQNGSSSNLIIPSPNHERRSSLTLESRSSLAADRSPIRLGSPITPTPSHARSTSYVRSRRVPSQPNQPSQPELPNLDVDVAERWIRDRRAGTQRTLPGEYLLERLATRDHVCISLLLCFQPLTVRRYS